MKELRFDALRTAGALTGLVVFVATIVACAGVLFTAPPGSTCQAIANPDTVPANGGTSLITVIVTEPIGTTVADGTIILFFTNLGTIDPQAKTKDGIAHANFVSDSRSGDALIQVSCGGPPGAVTNPSVAPSASAPPVTTVAGGNGSTTATVHVGNAAVGSIKLRADPPRITTSNSTHVFAAVFDTAGNPMRNVPVYFEVTDNVATEFFDATFPVFTNNNGEAENVMRTRRTTVGVAKVKASTPKGSGFVVSDELSIAIN